MRTCGRNYKRYTQPRINNGFDTIRAASYEADGKCISFVATDLSKLSVIFTNVGVQKSVSARPFLGPDRFTRTTNRLGTYLNEYTRVSSFIDMYYMDCRRCGSRNILRHRVALPSYVFTVVRARAHRFGPRYNQSFWYDTTVYVSYIAETEAVNVNNKKKYMP